MTGWRRAFCTSIPKHTDTNEAQTPRITTSKFGFFSNPSTPRSQPEPPGLGLRCRTSVATDSADSSTPNLNQKKSSGSRFFQFSNPSSPKSPSSFSFVKAGLRLSKSRCGICLQSVKRGRGTAIFTSECSHSFHFPCISAHIKKHRTVACPVCSSLWNDAPLLDNQNPQNQPIHTEKTRGVQPIKLGEMKSKPLKVYNDDEPLMSPTSGGRFNPIPESDENEDDEEQDSAVEFQGFFAKSALLASPRLRNIVKNVEVSSLPEAAVVAAGRSYETYAVVLKVKAPARSVTTSSSPTNRNLRPPIDLVTVLDVSASANSAKLQMVKRTMRLILSSLSCSDRLSIVAFSSSSKRLLSLRRMTSSGRLSARRIVDLLCEVGQGACVNDAIKKAAKVLEDRRERNPAASIILISDGQDDLVGASYSGNSKRSAPVGCSTRFSHLEIPVHAISFGDGPAPPEDALAKCVSGLLSVVVQDLRLQLGFVSGSSPAEIAAVYSLSSRPTALEPGSIRIGDLSSEEIREMLVELKVPISSLGTCPLLSVRSTFRDTSSQSQGLICSKQVIPVPRPRAVRSSGSNIERLRNLHVTIRAVAESQRLMEHHDFSSAQHLLSSARALLMKQSGSTSASEYLKGLDAESAALSRRKQVHMQSQRQNQNIMGGRDASRVDEKYEPLTPTSAWRAAERLAKVAIMRKSMNRVSDLHGFEDARF
ncbi:E3 ubiquitin-protein ligase WAVH1, partial [Cucurbita argyrosperma subsp. sororia]